VSALLLGTLLSTCAPTIDVHTVAFLAVDFAKYRTFSFGSEEGAPDEYETSSQSAEVRRRAQLLVAGFLRDKGYVQNQNGDADFVVQIACGRRERKEMRWLFLPHPRPTRSAWFDEHELGDFVEGILIIDVLDAKSNAPLWLGAARVDIDGETIDNVLLRRATNEVLASLPASRAH